MKKWIKIAAAAVVAVVLVKALVADSCMIPSSGMEESLQKGEGVLVSKWSYGLRLPFPSFIGYHRLGYITIKKGDIAVFNDPSQTDTRLEFRDVFIGRCTGTPGDTLMLDSEYLQSSVNDSLNEVHPFVVPQKSKTVKVHPWNLILLCNTIKLHEHKRAKVKGDTLFVEGKAVEKYRFTKDYYWMSSNNPANLFDSRFFGFVPEDHIIGKAWRIWLPKSFNRWFQLVK